MSDPPRIVHMWLPDGTIQCKGLEIAHVARPWPESPYITMFEGEVTCDLCKAALKRARGAA